MNSHMQELRQKGFRRAAIVAGEVRAPGCLCFGCVLWPQLWPVLLLALLLPLLLLVLLLLLHVIFTVTLRGRPLREPRQGMYRSPACLPGLPPRCCYRRHSPPARLASGSSLPPPPPGLLRVVCSARLLPRRPRCALCAAAGLARRGAAGRRGGGAAPGTCSAVCQADCGVGRQRGGAAWQAHRLLRLGAVQRGTAGRRAAGAGLAVLCTERTLCALPGPGLPQIACLGLHVPVPPSLQLSSSLFPPPPPGARCCSSFPSAAPSSACTARPFSLYQYTLRCVCCTPCRPPTSVPRCMHLADVAWASVWEGWAKPQTPPLRFPPPGSPPLSMYLQHPPVGNSACQSVQTLHASLYKLCMPASEVFKRTDGLAGRHEGSTCHTCRTVPLPACCCHDSRSCVNCCQKGLARCHACRSPRLKMGWTDTRRLRQSKLFGKGSTIFNKG